MATKLSKITRTENIKDLMEALDSIEIHLIDARMRITEVGHLSDLIVKDAGEMGIGREGNWNVRLEKAEATKKWLDHNVRTVEDIDSDLVDGVDVVRSAKKNLQEKIVNPEPLED